MEGRLCSGCGFGPFQRIKSHFKESPFCRPSPEDCAEKPALPPGQRESSLFRKRLYASLKSQIWSGHFNHYMSIAHLSLCVSLVVSIVLIVLAFLKSQMPDSRDIIDQVEDVIRQVPSVESIIREGERNMLRVDPIIFQVPNAKKGGCCFSIIQLVTVMLQESAVVRQHTIKASDEWKTGKLYGKAATTYKDVTHGKRFRSRHDICGEATAAQARDLRVGIHGWTDAFTSVDGLGVNARLNKYEAVLCALINLPLELRHYTDYLLLLAIYQSVFAKENGGLARLLTGTSSDGTVHNDGVTLASEVRLGQGKGTLIKLPSDVPGEDDITWNLLIFVVLFSLDWLAQGDFGPFAKSVSARRPCFKCMWTPVCHCAYLPATMAAKITNHHEHCLGRAPRTLSNTMREIESMRDWQGGANALKKRMTDLGIFSVYFASEHLLSDFVQDSTVDIMHVFLCGLSRYILSWWFDIAVPAFFTYAALNAKTRAHRFKKGVKIPAFYPRLDGKRSSKSAKLNAEQTMYFTLGHSHLLE